MQMMIITNEGRWTIELVILVRENSKLANQIKCVRTYRISIHSPASPGNANDDVSIWKDCPPQVNIFINQPFSWDKSLLLPRYRISVKTKSCPYGVWWMMVYNTNRPRDKHREQELKVKCIELTLVSFLPEPFTVTLPLLFLLLWNLFAHLSHWFTYTRPLSLFWSTFLRS